MAVFEDGFAAVRTFSDFDGMVIAMPSWNLEFARLSGGDFGARIEVASTARLQLSRFTVDTALLLTGSIPPEASGIALILSAPGGVRSRGRDIDARTTAPGRVQGQEVHFMTRGATDVIGVAADHALFERHFRAVTGRDAASLGPDWWIHPPPGTPDCLERGHSILALQSILARGAVFSPESRRRIEECVLQILLDGFAVDTAPARVAAAPARRLVARNAEEVLRARLDDPPSLRELCELVGVPERTLHHAFQESFGMAPKAYLRALRLSAVHRRLRQGRCPVTEAATDLGFFHFGRFAAEYRALFSETPSTTLRHARGNAAPD